MTTILGDPGAVSAGGGERSERARKKFEQRKVKNERKSCPWVSEDLRGCMTTNSVRSLHGRSVETWENRRSKLPSVKNPA